MSVKTGKKDPKGYDIYEWRDIIMPGIGDYRTDAARTGQYAGLSAAEWGEDVTETLDDVTVTYPQWCQVSVFRLIKGGRYEFSSGRVWWKETYATKGKSGAPNAMWLKRPRGQLEKCAEAAALRRAFPEVGAQPTAEEMEGRSLDDAVDITPLPVRPKAIEPPAEQQHPQPPEPPKRQHVDSPPESKSASPGAIRTIKTRLDAMNIQEKEVLDEFKLTTLDGITIDQHIVIMDWIGGK
jgi:phage recombination protein Bet